MILISNKIEALVFNIIGFDTQIIEDEQKLALYVKSLPKDIKLIVYDTYFKSFFDKYKRDRQALYPLILELPFDSKDLNNRVLDIKESIKKSIGIDLI